MPRIILLGTAGYHPSERRHTSCAMIPKQGIVIDAGTGLFRIRDHLVTDTLDIFLTHAHLDHSMGLTFLYDVIVNRKLKRITVYAAPEKLAAIEEHLFDFQLFPVGQPYEVRELTGDPVELKECSVSTFPLEHPGGSLGFRLDWAERSMAVVTDTTAREDAPYIEHIQDLDLLIHECFFPNGFDDFAVKTGHSWTAGVGAVARKAKPKRLVLNHFNPLDNVEPPIDLEQVGFPGTVLGEDGMVIEF